VRAAGADRYEDNEMMRPFRLISKFRMPLIVVGDANPGQ
jgi:hypothetical protein